jgi:hypothetical protein
MSIKYKIGYDEAFRRWSVGKFVNKKLVEVLPFETKEDAEQYVNEKNDASCNKNANRGLLQGLLRAYQRIVTTRAQ